ncbi:hypothetical protein B738_05859 [Photorhabdus temperata subsp. temperata M1021]|uniref:Uncharacterized protein n=1 Tax=Photorhabdus temperata J3 TaxID=1389415 RepID=U7R6J6_PHOTE|nr:hypothetical protein B738_05859 [Photorhabdus temperata subsp. temperata M1021]ERT14386.1 hypothetical protein O185_03220 [Photorhabdus temperata J3]
MQNNILIFCFSFNKFINSLYRFAKAFPHIWVSLKKLLAGSIQACQLFFAAFQWLEYTHIPESRPLMPLYSRFLSNYGKLGKCKISEI